jgi:3-deoxy-manno-octulosonate cytidylyltransferase (CMP-KDO synthetase)
MAEMDFRVIIPVRLQSKRLPEKALADIQGKPMIQHVYERALKSGATSVVIATDNASIAKAAEKFNAQVCMTASHHPNGTSRIAEAINALGYEDNEIIVNVQGDEPLIPPKVIRQLALDLSEHQALGVTTLCQPILNVQELFNPNIVKVVRNHRGFALYFSRAPIPWERENFNIENKKLEHTHYRHIGMYAYRAKFLNEYLGWEHNELAMMEDLEQLNILWQGSKIHVSATEEPIPMGVDTQEDLDQVRKLFATHKKKSTVD